MSYGIEIVNSDGRVIIDEKMPNMHLAFTEATVSSPLAYPPPGTISGDLVLVQPQNYDGLCYLGIPGTTNNTNELSPGMKYNIYRDFTSIAPVTSGYGLEILGPTGEVYFNNNVLDRSVTLVAHGVTSSDVTLPFTSLHDLYVVIDNTFYLSFYVTYVVFGYRFNKSSNSITIYNNLGQPMPYSIWRINS